MPIQMTRAEYESKYGQKPSLSPIQSNQNTPIRMTRAEYESKYGTPVEQPQEEGLLKRMGKALISSEIAAGNMIGTAISSVTQRKSIESTIKGYNDAGDKWTEMAKKETDPNKKQMYLKNAQQSYSDASKVWDEVIGMENLEKGSNIKQVAGAFGGVALDIATAGTYGSAAKLAKSGQLLKPVLKTAIPTVAKEVVATGVKSLAKKSAVGAGIGYGYDVTQSMQAGESLPDILTPGYGTLVGAAIPIGVAGAKGVYTGTKAIAKGIGKGISKVAQYGADISDEAVADYLAKTKKVDSLIAKNATPEQALEIAQGAVRNLRKNMSNDWQDAVDIIKSKYTNNITLDANRLKQVNNIAEKFGDDILNKVDEAGNITRINPLQMNVDDSLTLLKNINELYSKRIVRESAEGIPVRSFKDFFKKNIISNFGGDKGEIATLYNNYASKSEILNAADDIVKAYETGNPIKQSTSLGRIKSIYRENKGAYLKAIKDLEAETGVDITSYITASELGKGLTSSKVLTAGGAGIFSKKGILDKVFEAVLFPITTPKYARHLLKLGTQKVEPTMRQAMGLVEKQPSKTKTIIESMFPQKGKEAPKEVAKTILSGVKGKGGLSIQDVTKKGSPTVGETALIQEARKYKSAEEFVNSLSSKNHQLINPEDGGVYLHGTTKENYDSLLKNGFNAKLNKKGFAEQPEAFHVGDSIEAGMYGDRVVAVKARSGESVKTISRSDFTPEQNRSFKRGIDEINWAKNHGYDAINAGDELIIVNPQKFEVFDKSQLTDIWNKANKAGDDLMEQAKKYNSAEEFVKEYGEPMYHGGEGIKGEINPTYTTDFQKQAGTDKYKKGFSISSDKNVAKGYGSKVDEIFISPNAKIATPKDLPEVKFTKFSDGEVAYNQADAVKIAKEKGFDGVDLNAFEKLTTYPNNNLETQIFNPNIIKTKSQLKDIWNKAQSLQKEVKNPKKILDSYFKDWGYGEGSSKPLTKEVIDAAAPYRPKKAVTLYRGIEKGQKDALDKPMSWTYNKDIAKEHTYGSGKVILKKVNPDEILLDSTMLPPELQDKYNFFDEEMEVILKPKKIKGQAQLATLMKGGGIATAASGTAVSIKTLASSKKINIPINNRELEKQEEKQTIIDKKEEFKEGEGTFYDPKDPSQTRKNTDGTGAFGRKVGSGSIAVNNEELYKRAKFGKEIIYVEFPDLKDIKTPYGNGIFRIDDAMPRKKNGVNFDFIREDITEELKKKGRFKLKFKIITK